MLFLPSSSLTKVFEVFEEHLLVLESVWAFSTSRGSVMHQWHCCTSKHLLIKFAEKLRPVSCMAGLPGGYMSTHWHTAEAGVFSVFPLWRRWILSSLPCLFRCSDPQGSRASLMCGHIVSKLKILCRSARFQEVISGKFQTTDLSKRAGECCRWKNPR